MPLARFLDVCLDAADPALVAGFWREAAGARRDEAKRDDGVLRLHLPGAVPCSLWVNPVPEPRARVKTRVHLDVRLGVPDASALTEAGARILSCPRRDPWWVLADPEGNEFCALPPAEEGGDPPEGRVDPGIFELVVDAQDAMAQAQWWATVTAGAARAEEQAGVVTGAKGFPWRYWVFQSVPERKTVKNRLHWDVTLSGERPDALVEAGATLLRQPDNDIRWWVLADPEGNEFCAFPP